MKDRFRKVQMHLAEVLTMNIMEHRINLLGIFKKFNKQIKVHSDVSKDIRG